MKIPYRYRDYFKDVWADVPERGAVLTAVGPRGFVGRRWRCKQCGQDLKPNTAGAQSHIAKHLKEAQR